MLFHTKDNGVMQIDHTPFYKTREFTLIIILIVVNIINGQISDFYWDINGILGSTKIFLDKGFVILGMALILLIGEIDISVSANMALSSTIMGITYSAGVPMPVAMILCLLVGAGCGLLNGIIVTKFKELASMVVTLATMSLYRGIAWIILEDSAVTGYPDWLLYLSDGILFTIGDVEIPFILVAFIAATVIFGLILHKTVYGKRLFIIGNNKEAAYYSGIKVDKIKLSVFVLCGIMAAISSLFLTSKIFSSRPSMANGYDMEIITIAILGGMLPSGGRGRIPGVFIAVFIYGLMRYGLGLRSISTDVISIIMGGLLIISVLIPTLLSQIKRKSQNKKTIKSLNEVDNVNG